MQDSTHTSAQSPEVERERDRIKYLIEKLRSITLMVQLSPFIYTFLYIVSIMLYFFVSEDTAIMLDTLFYISPVVVIIFLVQSKMLKLCKWHKTACLLPLIAHIPVIIDTYIYELSTEAVFVNLTTILLMSALLLIAAYNVFFR